MAYPVPDLYSAASGKTIYAGSANLPDWVPKSSFMSPVSLNNMESVFDANNPDELIRGSRFILDVWNSTTYCEGYGPLGSILAFGGGHADYLGNEVYRYDIATRLWTRITDPTPVPIRVRDFDTVAGNSWGEFWTDETRTAVVVGKCAPPHTYTNMVYVPGSAAGNTNGWLVLMGGFSFQGHKVDLDNPSLGWSRLGPLFTDILPSVKPPAYGCSVWDEIRSKIHCSPSNAGEGPYGISLSIPSGTVTIPSQTSVPSYYTGSFHDTVSDRYIIHKYGWSGAVDIMIQNPNTGGLVTAAWSGDRPVGLLTIEWDPSRRQLIGWDGNSSNAALYICQAPSNVTTGTWVWSKISYTNTQAIILQSGVNGMFKRLHYVPIIDAYLLVARVDAAVQCWKP